MRDKNGFTMIEVIVTLVIFGILAGAGSLGLAEIMKSYVISRDGAKISQKAQLAMNRLNVELSYMTNGSIAADTDITSRAISYTATYPSANGSTFVTESHSILWNGTEGASLELDGQTLIDMVGNFTLTYYDANGQNTTTAAAVRTIDVNMTLTGGGILGTGSFSQHYGTRITPPRMD